MPGTRRDGLDLPKRTTAILLLAAVFTLGLGFQLKDTCNAAQWGSNEQYTGLCYNDIVALYGTRFLDRDTFPYVEHPGADAAGTPIDQQHGFVEYPIVTGLFMWMAARLGTVRSYLLGGQETSAEFFYWNAILLGLLGLATVRLLSRMDVEPRRVALMAAGLPLVLYAFHNWDLLAVFFATLGIYWWEKGRHFGAGAALALGTGAKLYAVLFAPLLLLALMRDSYQPTAQGGARDMLRALLRSRPTFQMAAGYAATLAALFGPFLIWGSPRLVWEGLAFHLRRGANIETPWFVLRHFLEKWGIPGPDLADPNSAVYLVGSVLLGSLYALTAWALWTRRIGHRGALLAALAAFMLLNKFFSVQYALWLLPFLVLAPLPRINWSLFFAADAWVYVTLFPLFASDFVEKFPTVSVGILGRSLALALIVWVLLWQAWRLEPAPRPLPATDALRGT